MSLLVLARLARVEYRSTERCRRKYTGQYKYTGVIGGRWSSSHLSEAQETDRSRTGTAHGAGTPAGAASLMLGTLPLSIRFRLGRYRHPDAGTAPTRSLLGNRSTHPGKASDGSTLLTSRSQHHAVERCLRRQDWSRNPAATVQGAAAAGVGTQARLPAHAPSAGAARS